MGKGKNTFKYLKSTVNNLLNELNPFKVTTAIADTLKLLDFLFNYLRQVCVPGMTCCQTEADWLIYGEISRGDQWRASVQKSIAANRCWSLSALYSALGADPAVGSGNI